MSFIFLKIYDFFRQRKFLLFVVLFLLVAFFLFMATRIRVSEDITDFLPKTKATENIHEVLRMVNSGNDLGIILTDNNPEADPDKLISYAGEVNRNLENLQVQGMVKNITCKFDDNYFAGTYDLILRNLPFFLDREDYDRIEKMLTPEHIDSVMLSNYKLLLSPAGTFLKKQIVSDPLNIGSLAMEKMRMPGIGSNFRIYKNHIFSQDLRHLLMFVQSSYPANESFHNKKLIKELDNIIREHKANTGRESLTIQYYGTVAASVGNSVQLKKDVVVTLGIAILILFIFFSVFFRKKTTFILVLIPVVFGGLFSMAILSLLNDDISLIALGAGSIILGVALTYSIHFFSHYRHTGSVRQVIKDLSLPLTLGSVTTIGAFLGLLFVRSEVLNDFGLAAAMCLLGSVLCTLIFLPFIIKHKNEETGGPSKTNIIDRISAYHPERNPYLIVALAVITVFLFFMAGKPGFETDMNTLGYTPEKLRQAETTLQHISGDASRQVFLISKGDNLNAALQHNENACRKIMDLKLSKAFCQIQSVSPLLPSDSMQQVKAGLWKEFWNNKRRQNTKNHLAESARQYDFSEDAFHDFYSLLDKNYSCISPGDFGWLKEHFAQPYIHHDEKNNYVFSPLKIKNQRYDQVLAAIPETTNTLVVEPSNILTQFIEIIKKDFNTILLISSLLVFLFLLISYGRIELAITAFIPMLISWVWILGFMSLFHIKFNIFSIIISAFIFGLGDDFSIFIMDGLLQKYKKGIDLLDSYKTAVLLSAFTMFVGIGVLIFAKHPALRSIALLTIIGMFSVVFCSYTIAPALFRVLVYKKNKFRKFPLTAYGISYAVVCYTYFLLGCIITALLGLTIYKVLPVSKKKRQLLYHQTLYGVCRSTMYLMYFTKKKIINFTPGTLKEPAVIIANHQSIIDIPLFLMFSPKVIMITNDAFYNSKLIGIIVKLGGFLPASLGYDVIAQKIKPVAEAGYSVIIFPEGTRSTDGHIGRFHKGAFYLAEQLHMDILPIVSHGTGNYIAKDDLLGKKSLITVKFLDRIKPGDTAMGANYTERTKNIQHHFRQEHQKLLNDYYSDTRLYRDILIKNFIYKGPVLEWYTRIKSKLENNYSQYNDIIPRDARIIDIGCGYGYLSMMLAWVSPKRKIVAIDYDRDKIDVASHCLSKPPNVMFSHEDITSYEFGNSDVFILSDVLHYLTPENQFGILHQCVDRLNAGGIILIRDANKDSERQHRKTRWTEFMSTNFGFNKTANDKLHFFSAARLADIAASLNVNVQIIKNPRITSNTLYLIKK
ncbi:MAG TPA: MMPL family transporter [Bacteroidales bacterium]|nr:MMPL family transporter [Bacteroidales bacterium]